MHIHITAVKYNFLFRDFYQSYFYRQFTIQTDRGI